MIKEVKKTITDRKFNFIIFSLILLCLSCQAPTLYDQFQAIENATWEKDKEYYFTFTIPETSTPYNLTLEIRNNNLYPFQNLWIFYQIEQPIGPIQKDTIECMLADDFGKWYGKGISLFQAEFPLCSNYYFPNPGQYTFSFRQGMRTDALKGVQEIGFRVEKAER